MHIFSVRDVKMSQYENLILDIDAIPAIRSFSAACKDKNTNLYQNAGDFELVEMGTFDKVTGRITQYDIPKLIVTAQQVKNETEATKEHIDNQQIINSVTNQLRPIIMSTMANIDKRVEDMFTEILMKKGKK